MSNGVVTSEKDFEKLRKERKEDASIRTSMADEIKKIETDH
jgi:hypothetical protein